jgi:16S rRNA (guanine966-N2)-methyltransferase
MPHTRITGGEWRGRVVETPRGSSIRPTRSMVRQALFNVLGARIVDAHFVDLFAGAGTVAFEALSRGAARATLVEQSREQLSVIASNAARFECRDRCRLIHSDAARWLRNDPGQLKDADICFVDAPYRDAGVDRVLALLGEHPPKLVVCEHHRARSLPERTGELSRVRELHHGLTTLTFLQPNNEQTQT